MKNIVKACGLALPLLLSLGATPAYADATWRRVAYLDFGGNSESDANIRTDGLRSYEGESSITFKASISNGTTYAIAKHADDDASKRPTYWTSGGDHTYASNKEKGYFLMLNCPNGCTDDCGSLALDYSKSFIYQKTLTNNICSGVTFKFEAWVALIDNVDKASSGSWITLGIFDGSGNKLWQQDAIQPAASTDGAEALNWTKVEGEFPVPDNADLSAISFRIYPMMQGEPWAEALGYDFGLDDIAIYVQQPSLSFSQTELLYEQPGSITATLDATDFFSNMNDVAFIWEYSEDGESGWTKVASGTYASDPTFAYNFTKFNKDDKTGQGNGYYRLTLATKNNIDDITDESVCCVRGVHQVNETKNKVSILLCDGDSKTIDGQVFTKANAGGSPILTTNNYEVTTEVILNTPKDSIITSCVGQDYPAGSGNVYNVVGETYDLNANVVKSTRLSSATGQTCDSVTINQKLKIIDGEYIIKDWEHICAGKTANANQKLYSTPGDFKDTSAAFDGCKKNIFRIAVHPVYDTVITTVICENTVYKDKKYTAAGDYNLTKVKYSSYFGCDSSVVETVRVTSHTETALPDVELCQSDFGEGKTAYSFDGQDYVNTSKKDMVLNLTKTDISEVNGCDSITTVKVTIHPLIHEYRDTLICLDQILFGVEWTKAGLYPKSFTYTSASGCDSIVTWNITVLDIQLKLRAEFDQTSVCEGQSATLIVDLIPSDVPLTWEPELTSRNPLRPVVTPEESTVYIAHAKNSVGCHATDSIYITVNPAPSLSIDSVDQLERTLTFNVTGGTPEYTYWVATASGTDDDTDNTKTSGNGKEYTPNGNTIEGLTYGKHVLRVIDASGCAAVDTFSLEPTPIEPSIYFSPNGDGVSDRWEIKGIDAYPEAVVYVYDRYGKLLFKQEGYDATTNGFNGEYNGNLLPSTDYWYVIDLESVDMQYIGHFTLLR